MGKYSIKELELLSGIKAHTIRIWEKRYQIISPSRTNTNIRFYSDDDLKKIINVSLLNNNGVKISKIATMSMAEMNQRVLAMSEIKADVAVHMDQLVVAMIDMEEEAFEKILNTLILRYGFEKTLTEIVYPFLEKIGILWQTKNITPAHEHFTSNLIRQKIIVAIDGLQIPSKSSKKILLFLPENEMHEIGLLFYHYLSRKAGYRTYYLGQSVPHEDLVKVFQIHQPDVLITSITSNIDGGIDRYLQKLSDDFPTVNILAAGLQAQGYTKGSLHNVRTFSAATDLRQYL